VKINEDAPAVARASIQVSAPAEVVWDVLADFESWPSWDPAVRSMSLDGPMRRQLQKGLDAALPHLKAEAERRADR
jgi:uncharacterized membrane protein